MRIICDHCSLPIAGTVKRLAGNLNLHPQCLTEPRKEAKRESSTFTSRPWSRLDRSAEARDQPSS